MPYSASLRDERLRLTTLAPRVDRPFEARRERRALAAVVGPEDADRDQLGVGRERVDDPRARRPVPDDVDPGSAATTSGSPSSPTRRACSRAACRRPPDGRASTPESMIATVTPRPGRAAERPRRGHVPNGRGLVSASRRSPVNGSLQAGRSSVGQRRPVGRRAVAPIGGREDAEQISVTRASCSGSRPPDPGDRVDQRPQAGRRLGRGPPWPGRRSPRRSRPRRWSRGRALGQPGLADASSARGVAFDAARADGDRGLAREDRRELDVAQAERAAARLSSTSSTPMVPPSSTSGTATIDRGT